jgi:hypothetical protein
MSAGNLVDYPHVVSGISADVVIVIYILLGGGCAAYLVYQTIKKRDLLPIAVLIGTLICSLNEPIYDLLGKIVYAEDQYMAYRGFDRNIPWFVILSYIPWLGLFSYLVSQWMANGISAKKLQIFAIFSFLAAASIEAIGNLTHVWIYYGEHPIKAIGVAPQTAPMPLVTGFLIYLFASRLKGISRLAIAIIPTMSLPFVYAGTSWPGYVGAHMDVAIGWKWLAAFSAVGLSVLTMLVVPQLYARYRDGEIAIQKLAER